jgi:enoyl-CoA hydratase/carnithine racemase
MDITITHAGPIASLGFARPARRNAITGAMYTALADAIVAAEASPEIRVIVMHGSDVAFTAGNDLEDFLAAPGAGQEMPVFRFLKVMSAARKPIVAAVEGPAIGIGTTLLLHCELVFAGEGARFQLPFAALGVVPEFASSYLLPLIAGYHRAAELLMLAEPFDSQHALACGIVNRVTPAGGALAAAREAAARLAALPERSIVLTKELMKAPHAAAVQRQLEAESAHFRRMLGEPAARQALEAFLKRRKAP